MNKYQHKSALVTGANRGIGRALVEELLKSGVSRVYAAVRNAATLEELVAQSGGRVIPVEIDVTKPETIKQATANISNLDILINNAGVATFKGLVAADSTDFARAEMEVNYFGTLNMIRAFAPALAASGGGTIVNMSSIAGRVNFPVFGSYCAAKAAVHSLTQGVRAELAAQGTVVVGVYPGPVETDMGAHFPMDCADPVQVAQTILADASAGKEEIFPDVTSQNVHVGLTKDPSGTEKMAGKMLPA